jgi:hypothetical protein
MQQGCLVKTASFLGVALVVLGVMLLAYFASPVDLLAKGLEYSKPSSVSPVFGGLFLISGIALLYVTRKRH